MIIDDFIIRAIICGIGVAIAAGPLGSFIVWKRMSFFGDAISHSALLGVAAGYIMGVGQTAGVLLVAMFFVLFMAYLQNKKAYSADTLLGIIAHSALALGIVAISFTKGAGMQLMGFLFGDILATDNNDIILIYAGSLVSLAVLFCIWRPLLLCTINSELAKTEGVNVNLVAFKFMLLITVLVALSIKVVGVLLVTSLLIIPAAAARNFAKTPEVMAVKASIIGCFSVIAGIFASLNFDTPSGPSIVVAALIIFILSSLVKLR